MSNNILIMGAQRCGKSTVSNFITQKHYKQYEILRGDPAMIATFFCRGNELKNLDDNQRIKFYKTLFKETQIDLMSTQKKVIMDTMDLDAKEAYQNFNDKCDIYCFGMPNEKTENLVKTIRETEKYYDWTFEMSNMMLEIACNEIIEISKQLEKDCKELGITFFDTAGDRQSKLKKAISIIEERSI